MVEYVDLDGNLTRALHAVRDLRLRCLRERWGAPNLTVALAFGLAIDEHAAVTAGQATEWSSAERKGRDLAEAVIGEERRTRA